MKTQADLKIRAVSLANLEAMCERASGVMCHTFQVSKVSRSRVHVEYSNENEWASAEPMTAVFPAIPNPFETENPYVLIGHLLRVIGDNWDGEGWQAFDPITAGPELFRSAPGANDWQTREEILKANDRA